MSSRLDRLFLLLETGSSPVTRKAAALQIGEVQKLHPHELHNLLAKAKQYLHSSSWDTRIAAGQAVEAIIRNIPQWEPAGCPNKQEEPFTRPRGMMSFTNININKVIENGSSLLASEGKEYEMVSTDGKTDAECKAMLASERLIQAQNLGFFENLGMDAQEVISTDDLKIAEPNDKKNGEGISDGKGRRPLVSNLLALIRLPYPDDHNTLAKQSLAEMFPISECASKLQVDKCKNRRKSLVVSKQKTRESCDYPGQIASTDEDPPRKIRRVTSVLVEQPSNEDAMLLDNVPDNSSLWEESTEWPLTWFCHKLGGDLFSCSWEVRHGAATALREVTRIHGKGAGKRADSPADQLYHLNQIWLEDMALRLLCVLALDKFGDFISDQVVAPVRETCAQALGSILRLMCESSIESVLAILLDLLKRPEWEARHGGLLAMKYLITLKEEHLAQLIPVVFEPIFKGLQDPIDDVSAVAAAALVPITDVLVKTLPEKVPEVVSVLWSMLLELDDLTASTSSILTLLASLLSYPFSHTSTSLTTLVPRLWPFCGHSSTSVRKSVLRALATLTTATSPKNCEEWIPPILSDMLRLIFQRVLVEHDHNIQEQLYVVWCQILNLGNRESFLSHLLTASCPYLSGWLCLLMHPSRATLDPALITVWFQPKHKAKEKACLPVGVKCRYVHQARDSGTISEQYSIGGSETQCETTLEWEKNVVRARFMAAKLLGLLSVYVTQAMPGVVYTQTMESPLDCFAKLLLFHLNSKSALQRLAVALLLYHWAHIQKENPCPLSVKEQCLTCLSECVFYDEIAFGFTRMQQESQDFLACLSHHNLLIDDTFRGSTVLTTTQIQSLTSTVFTTAVAKVKLRAKVLEVLEERRKSVVRILKQTTSSQTTLNTQVQACLSSALVSLRFLPDKLNPVIRPLMESLKHEEIELLRDISAKSLVCLMEQCLERIPCPNTKIIKNLVGLVCSDPTFAPIVTPETSPSLEEDNGSSSGGGSSLLINNSSKGLSHVSTKYQGILLLQNMQKNAEKTSLRRANSTTRKNSVNYETSVPDSTALSVEDMQQKILQRKGAACGLKQAVEHFGDSLPDKLPKLWETIVKPLETYTENNNKDDDNHQLNDEQAQELATNLLILEVTVSYLHASLHPKIISLLPALLSTLEHPYTVIRHLAARSLGMISKVLTSEVMELVVGPLLANLGATHCLRKRQGAAEAIACVVEQMGLQVIPYIVLLVVPMLGRMSDQNEAVRVLATQTFATLIRLMPLESGIQDLPSLSPELLERKQENRTFLEQLLDSRRAESYKVAVPIEADLRSYQQDGVNWLAFLNKYKLHGILCDDMGLGKTLQSLCILASDHFLRDQKYKETQSADCTPLPSLVICPPTLTGHWMYEVEKFVSLTHLKPLHYTGPPGERVRLRTKAKKHNLIIASYDIVRNDIDFFGSIHWNYCILDEGHVIKNGKTKLSQAIKQLSANHRLILSGTPIQNNVLELWSLFDFLMPGFLGSEKQFTAKYSKPILLSRDAKSSSREQEAGVLALESLHRQVLPFVLRRMKEDVLQDLPPKIIQDYYCELSPLQVQLYEDFSKSRAHKNLEGDLEHAGSSETTPGAHSHVFQALQYLRKVCNHPKLVLNSQHPEYPRICSQLKNQNTDLADIQHAAKLSALKQLLLDCGIGVTSGMNSSDPQPAVNQHRALIFCQLKGMLDILEKDLLKAHLPSVSYLRLDGSVPPGNRHSVVHRFNNDPSIDLLLLTTQVGGLGLNLTGADTVIFVEHDWNPMKDMQAMDRAHRIGQKKVVNVYRLITRGTLEEKIMGLQKFKMTVASTVITQENTSLHSMGTEQVLDLFLLDQTGIKSKSAGNTDSPKKKSVRSVLENLPELWDCDQYESEYELTNFMQLLNK